MPACRCDRGMPPLEDPKDSVRRDLALLVSREGELGLGMGCPAAAERAWEGSLVEGKSCGVQRTAVARFRRRLLGLLRPVAKPPDVREMGVHRLVEWLIGGDDLRNAGVHNHGGSRGHRSRSSRVRGVLSGNGPYRLRMWSRSRSTCRQISWGASAFTRACSMMAAALCKRGVRARRLPLRRSGCRLDQTAIKAGGGSGGKGSSRLR